MDKNIFKNLNKKVTVAEIIQLLGGRVVDYPLLGKTIFFNKERISEVSEIVSTENVKYLIEFTSEPGGDPLKNGELCRIWIGHRYSGPMLLCQETRGEWKWSNLYSHDDFEKTDIGIASGGHFDREFDENTHVIEFDSAMEALENRKYNTKRTWGKPYRHTKKRYTESALLIQEVLEWVKHYS